MCPATHKFDDGLDDLLGGFLDSLDAGLDAGAPAPAAVAVDTEQAERQPLQAVSAAQAAATAEPDQPDQLPLAMTAPVAARAELVKQLLSDPRGLYANPHTIDWTTTPIAAMRLTIEHAEEALRQIPIEVSTVVQSGLADAAAANNRAVNQMAAAFTTVFWSADLLKHGHRGIIIELDERVAAINSQLTQLSQELGTQTALNKDLALMVAGFNSRAQELERIVGEREAAVARRENSAMQREAALKTAKARFDGLGFWGHVGHAFIAVPRSQLGAGVGLVFVLGLIALAVRGAKGLIG